MQLLTPTRATLHLSEHDAAVFRSRTTARRMCVSHGEGHIMHENSKISFICAGKASSTTKSGNWSQSRRASTRVSRKQLDVSCHNETYYIFRVLRNVQMSGLFKRLFVFNVFGLSASVRGRSATWTTSAWYPGTLSSGTGGTSRCEPFREDSANEVQRLKELSGELLQEKQHKRKQHGVRVSNTPDEEQRPAHVRRKPASNASGAVL